MTYPYGKSHRPHLTYAVARVLMGLDPALREDPEDAMNVAEPLPEEPDAPAFGFAPREDHAVNVSETTAGGVFEYVEWFYDGDEGAFSAV